MAAFYSALINNLCQSELNIDAVQNSVMSLFLVFSIWSRKNRLCNPTTTIIPTHHPPITIYGGSCMSCIHTYLHVTTCNRFPQRTILTNIITIYASVLDVNKEILKIKYNQVPPIRHMNQNESVTNYRLTQILGHFWNLLHLNVIFTDKQFHFNMQYLYYMVFDYEFR